MSSRRDTGGIGRMKRIHAWYVSGFIVFVAALSIAEAVGLSHAMIGYAFLGASLLTYAVIGVVGRTNNEAEYYVAGRQIPAFFNGLATAADWLSAASFIGLAGGLYVLGFGGLAYVLGWTGGFVLVGLLLAPYLRRFGRYTIPDFIGARYGGNVARATALSIAIACSFIYVVAQIFGVGLIATRLTGVDFTVGIFLGLAGVLVCSFLGGMRAVTWTQAVQCIVLVVAYLVPVIWLSINQTGIPIPQLAYGLQLPRVTELEEKLERDPREREVREILAQRAIEARHKLNAPEDTFKRERAELQMRRDRLLAAEVAGDELRVIDDQIAHFPRSVAEASAGWQRDVAAAARAAPVRHHAEPFPGDDEGTRDLARLNFVALVFCLVVGTAGLPHILVRYYTTPSVRETRSSVFWTLFFVLLVYLSAPALAVLVKYAIYHDLVGSYFPSLPGWVQSWAKVDPALLSITDINGDGIVQLAEVALGQDVIVLATPEIAGLPFVVSGLVAAGGLAAALSTADGLLLTIGNALSHDFYFKMINPGQMASRRVLIAKMLLLAAAVLAALAAALKPTNILFLVTAAFSIAGASLFPALVLGIFWSRATGLGATLGMLAGFGTTCVYIVRTDPWLRELVLRSPASEAITARWWGIEPAAAGVFGVAVGFVVIVVVSLLTRQPSQQARQLVQTIRSPDGVPTPESAPRWPLRR